MSSTAILQQVIVGISTGVLLFLVSSGLTLVFGVLRVINFAHGSLYMLGAFLAITIAGYFTAEVWGFIAAILLVPLLVAAVGMVLERLFFRPIYKREHLMQLLMAYGLTLIIGDAVRMIWGSRQDRVDRPEFLSGRETIEGIRIARYDIFLLAVGLLIGFALWYLLQRTRFGRITRAAVSNPEMLDALGINVNRVFTLSFMLGAWLAGLGGSLLAARETVALGMDAEIIVQAFAIVVIGGLGSFAGAFIGSMLVGITLSVAILLPSMLPEPFGEIIDLVPAQALPFLAMAIILIVRPWGLLGRPER